MSEDVIAAIIRKQRKLLTLYHNKLQLYTVPLGKVNPGESIHDALLRELKEELDVEVTSCSKVGKANIIIEDRDITFHIFDIHSYNGIIVNNEPHKHSEMLWNSLSQLIKIHKDNKMDKVTTLCMQQGLI